MGKGFEAELFAKEIARVCMWHDCFVVVVVFVSFFVVF